HIRRFLEGSNLVADDALQVVGETTGGEQIGQSGGQRGVGGRVGVVVLCRLVQGLRPDEGGKVGVLLVHERHEAALGQLGLAPVADGDLGRAAQIDPAVIGRKNVGGQSLNVAARLDATNARAPTVELEGAVDVDGHSIG